MPPSTLEFKVETLSHLLADRLLTVPAYQRPYAWEPEHVTAFWSDLAASLEDSRDYFIGAIVLTPTSDGRFHVIDGQQRLVTASLLLAAIRDELAGLGEIQDAQHVESRYLQSYDRAARSIVPRLAVAPIDADFFVDRFINRSGGEASSASQRRMLAAFTELRRAIQRVASGEDSAQRAVALNAWLDHLEVHVIIVVVEAATDADAFLIFETLNDRGAPLTIADLLKNYLMSLDPSQAAALQQAWEQAVSNLGTDIETQDFVTFIRHFWNSVNGATRERDLYRSLRSTIESGRAAAAFVESLAEASEPYAAMLDPAHARWADASDVSPRAIETLLYFQLGQYRPLLLASIERFDDEEVERLGEALVCWSFRGLIVGGIGGGTTERAYSLAAVNVRFGASTSADAVYAQLRPNIPTDEDFRNAFERASVARLRLAHYVLRSLNRALESESHPALEPFPSERSAPVAMPLLPRNAAPLEWRGFAADDLGRHVSRIGNMVLRPPGRRAVPDDREGRMAWALSLHYAINQAVAEYDSWSPDAIRHRQQDMAALAVATWPREPR